MNVFNKSCDEILYVAYRMFGCFQQGRKCVRQYLFQRFFRHLFTFRRRHDGYKCLLNIHLKYFLTMCMEVGGQGSRESHRSKSLAFAPTNTNFVIKRDKIRTRLDHQPPPRGRDARLTSDDGALLSTWNMPGISQVASSTCREYRICRPWLSAWRPLCVS